jgi:pimeloyl-ACP methyl ester carboxylesterase
VVLLGRQATSNVCVPHPAKFLRGGGERIVSGKVGGVKFVLIHGAPAGPATWRWVAEVLTSAGHEVVVPDLRRAAMSGQPSAVVREAVTACSADTNIVAGHSGAGLILPAIVDSLPSSARPRLVFVDAAIPECDGDARLDPVVVDLLRPLAVEGVLPPGFLWLGEGGLERLIPDSEMRARVEAELPELPMTLFEEGLPVAAGWCEWRCDYLLLSEEMRGEAERARSLGWSVLEDVGNHLDVVNRAAEVAADLVRIAV